MLTTQVNQDGSSRLNLFCRIPWPLARTRATSSGLVRSPAAHAPGVRSGRSCRMPATRPGESPARPAVGSGWSSHTRLQQPAGAVCFRPRAQPTLRRHLTYSEVYGGACPSCVTPGQRRTPYAWSSGLLPPLTPPRTSRLAARVCGKGFAAAVTRQAPRAAVGRPRASGHTCNRLPPRAPTHQRHSHGRCDGLPGRPSSVYNAHRQPDRQRGSPWACRPP